MILRWYGVNNANNSSIDANHYINIIFKTLWCINIIFLFTRVLHFLMLSSHEGPLVNSSLNMLNDIFSFLKYILLYYFLIGGAHGNVLLKHFLNLC